MERKTIVGLTLTATLAISPIAANTRLRFYDGSELLHEHAPDGAWSSTYAGAGTAVTSNDTAGSPTGFYAGYARPGVIADASCLIGEGTLRPVAAAMWHPFEGD